MELREGSVVQFVARSLSRVPEAKISMRRLEQGRNMGEGNVGDVLERFCRERGVQVGIVSSR